MGGIAEKQNESMLYRHYLWIILFIFFNCTLFFQKNEFEKGVRYYQEGNFSKAAHYFSEYYSEHPESDTTLYFLYDCYNKLQQHEKKIAVLEQFVKLRSENENVYLNLFRYYQTNGQYYSLYTLLAELQPVVRDTLDTHYVVTRRLYAELASGAFNITGRSDPMVFATSHGYLPLFPDTKFYEDDTITQGNLIILLDRLVAPLYPNKFYTMRYISSHSFLYLPYMRLVDLGVLEFNPELNPNENARVSTVVTAFVHLKKEKLRVLR
jgi:tetratricopeptide (TPR) repeat protein